MREAGLREMLALRERQLAVMVTHLDASRAEVAAARRHAGGDLAQLRAALSQRQAELVALVTAVSAELGGAVGRGGAGL